MNGVKPGTAGLPRWPDRGQADRHAFDAGIGLAPDGWLPRPLLPALRGPRPAWHTKESPGRGDWHAICELVGQGVHPSSLVHIRPCSYLVAAHVTVQSACASGSCSCGTDRDTTRRIGYTARHELDWGPRSWRLASSRGCPDTRRRPRRPGPPGRHLRTQRRA